MATILIWMSPEPGHLLPTIKIARDLTRRGHSVIYQTRGEIRKELEQLGFSTIGFCESVATEERTCLFQPTDSAGWQFVAIFNGQPNSKQPAILRDELLRGVAATGADLLLVDATFDRLFSLEMHRYLPSSCRVARIYTHLPWLPPTPAELALECGPMIFLIPAEFELPARILPQAIYAEGSAFEGVRHVELPQIDSSSPVIYCSLGSQIDRYAGAEYTLERVAAAAALMSHCQFILNAGILGARLKFLERDNLRVFSYLPQVAMLRRSSAMILHGGLGSIKDCILQRVPMLVLPQRWDQPDNGLRVQHHGLGLALELDEANAFSIATGIASLLNEDSYRSNLDRMSGIFVEKERRQVAADACESVLAHQEAIAPA